jgi:SAM-dependent methyltransferase
MSSGGFVSFIKKVKNKLALKSKQFTPSPSNQDPCSDYMEKLAFNERHYKSRNVLRTRSAVMLLHNHFILHGQDLGLEAHPLQRSKALIAAAKTKEKALEIGPFCKPALVGQNIKYFDVLDQQGLINRASSSGFKKKPAPFIEFVSPCGDLSIINEKFDVIFAAHCIEHQPDLIDHLNKVANILSATGKYFLIIPDKRYCFDHFIQPSSVEDVIDAHNLKLKTHSRYNVIAAETLSSHNNRLLHWLGEHGKHPNIDEESRAYKSAIDQYNFANGAYIDVHAWRFSPTSFYKIVETLYTRGLIGLRPKIVCATCRGRKEFTAILSKN